MKRLRMVLVLACASLFFTIGSAVAQETNYDEYRSFVSSTAMTMEHG